MRIRFLHTVLVILLTSLAAAGAGAQERIFWDFPEPLNLSGGDTFPRILRVGDYLALVRQEFTGEPESLDARISVKVSFSRDGAAWDSPPLTIAEGIPYLWVEKIPLYSVKADSFGRLVAAVAESPDKVAVYRQKAPGPLGTFVRSAVISAGAEAADAVAAVYLTSRSDGGMRLFLTRRTAVQGASRPSTLTILASESDDGSRWSAPMPFIDPDRDRAVDGAVLEQNFLPHHAIIGGREYLVFQTLRQGDEGQVFQLYVKTRSGTGEWGAAQPVTERLLPSSGESDPLLWDNQRPFIGASVEGEVLVAWERRLGRERPGIAMARLDAAGRPADELMEDVVTDRYTSAAPGFFIRGGVLWVLWFDDTGIRIARRDNAFSYDVGAGSLDAKSPASDRGSAAFPRAVYFQNDVYIFWRDRSGGVERSVLLRPDAQVDPPRLSSTNFRTDRPGNRGTAVVNWIPPQDSSGILSHSWRWSRNPDDLPSKDESARVYGDSRAVFDFGDAADTDGTWYFSLIAQDSAENWSEPLRLSYTLDRTPPPPPVIIDQETDTEGFLVSNSFSVQWEDGEDEPAAYYRWRMDYLGSADAEVPDIRSLGGTESTERITTWRNLDNGVWAFSAAAVDQAGNEGQPNTVRLFLNRYVPVTFITDVSASRDESDTLRLSITGRGYTAGGLLTRAVIDRDGREPWDYELTRAEGRLSISSDRAAEVKGIDRLEAGEYFIGVSHPQRGTVFWNRRMSLDSVRTVKFGPFDIYSYESMWTPAADSPRLRAGRMLLAVLGLFIAGALTVSIVRVTSVAREMLVLRMNAAALLRRMPLSIAARKEAAVVLRRKGMGLRNKFTLALSLLSVFTILTLSAVLGFVWLRMERDTQAEALASESRLLVETLASSAVAGIPDANRGELLLLPDRISALPDALWTTVTGPRGEITGGTLRATSAGSEYIWASNDPDILDKIALPDELSSQVRRRIARGGDETVRTLLDSAYPADSRGTGVLNAEFIRENRAAVSELLRTENILPFSPGIGMNRIDDDISDLVETLRREVEQEAASAGIARMIAELTLLEEQYAELAAEVALTLDFDNPAFAEAEAAAAAQRREIETLLLEIAGRRFTSYPEFSAESLRPGGPDSFLFYRPLLYRVGSQDSSFFRGIIRLSVSVDDVRASITRVARRIIIITVIASVAALALGILVALFIASLIVRPITSLARGVSIIRDQPDMLQHEDFDVSLNTKDELAGLADTINGMVKGLIQAALEQKELVAGQEIQKTFLPLETGESGRKLSTGGARSAFFRLFGYYEGADAVSGDYFDFRKLDDDHYVMIKLDIAGHGVTASLIMVQVAALYVDYFRRVRDRAAAGGALEYDLRAFTFGINDLINEVGFRGRFAAFNLSVINVRTAEYRMINAGDNLVNIFKADQRKLVMHKLPDGPAAGQIPSDLIELNPQMYQVVSGHLERGDILFLFTDGIEEAHHVIRSADFSAVEYRKLDREVIGRDQQLIEPTYEYFTPRQREGETFETPTLEDKINAALDDENLRIREGTSRYKQIDASEYREEFDSARVRDVIEAALNRGEYQLQRRCDLTIGKPLHFDFSELEPSGENAVLALASVEKVFRIIPDTSGGSASRVRVDRKIADFLGRHFREFSDFYSRPVDEDEGSVYFSHLREDPQDDDLTIWTYERL